jgi:hypothetical protein
MLQTGQIIRRLLGDAAKRDAVDDGQTRKCESGYRVAKWYPEP